MKGYHSVNASSFDGIPRLALPCPWLMINTRSPVCYVNVGKTESLLANSEQYQDNQNNPNNIWNSVNSIGYRLRPCITCIYFPKIKEIQPCESINWTKVPSRNFHLDEKAPNRF